MVSQHALQVVSQHVLQVSMGWYPSMPSIGGLQAHTQGEADIITARQQSCGKVMFTVVSVCEQVWGMGGSHVTITHDVLDHTIQGPPSFGVC